MMIDREGKVVIVGRYNDAEAFTDGLARVHEGGKFEITLDGPAFWSGGAWFYIDKQGDKVRRCRDDTGDAPYYGKDNVWNRFRNR